MPDRVEELVAAIDANTLLQWDGRDVALEAAHELATIARAANARADEAETENRKLTEIVDIARRFETDPSDDNLRRLRLYVRTYDGDRAAREAVKR